MTSPQRDWGLTLLFSVAVATSAFLLFSLQPLLGKALLPYLGGTAAVWNGCMLFFQALLLLGYIYAHGIVTRVPASARTALHLGLAALAGSMLPISVGAGWTAPDPHAPTQWLLATLLRGVALPFFVLSATAPLLQAWFRGGGKTRRDPYFLYAASNAGSMLALIAYPTLIEPRLDLDAQARWWTVGYVVFVLLAGACAFAVRREREAAAADAVPTASGIAAVSWGDRLRWGYLAFVPSTLMLSVTAYVTTDLAPVPLLWTVPLALYLLTFIVAFGRVMTGRTLSMLATLTAVAVLLVTYTIYTRSSMVYLPLHLTLLLLAGLMCHGELSRSRPAPARLTEFFLWLAVGGAAGGLFNAVVAPLVFVTLAEYGVGLLLLLVAAALVRREGLRLHWTDAVAVGALAAAIWGSRWVRDQLLWEPASLRTALLIVGVPMLVIGLASMRRTWRRALLFGSVLVAFAFSPLAASGTLYQGRNFYGPVQVARSGSIHVFYHGSTLHGVQRTDAGQQCEPVAYYARQTPVGQLFMSFTAERFKFNIAVLGLGTAGLAAYAQPGQSWTFYELNPLVADIARDPRYFTYLTQCAGNHQIELGDGRLALARQPDGVHDVLVLDAFSSDAVPVHLLTREALTLYFQKLSSRGLLAIHITNRYIDLAPVLGALTADAGLAALARFDSHESASSGNLLSLPSDWVVVARDSAHFGYIVHDPRWRPLSPGAAKVWRDGFSNVFAALKVGWREVIY